MRTPRFSKTIGVLVAGSIMFGSTGAVAATSPASIPQFDPWAVLSVMNGGASAAAACGMAVTAAAAAAAQPASGCVLPQINTVLPRDLLLLSRSRFLRSKRPLEAALELVRSFWGL